VLPVRGASTRPWVGQGVRKGPHACGPSPARSRRVALGDFQFDLNSAERSRCAHRATSRALGEHRDIRRASRVRIASAHRERRFVGRQRETVPRQRFELENDHASARKAANVARQPRWPELAASLEQREHGANDGNTLEAGGGGRDALEGCWAVRCGRLVLGPERSVPPALARGVHPAPREQVASRQRHRSAGQRCVPASEGQFHRPESDPHCVARRTRGV
jgi:hypothetical protein